jgi:DNA-binding transcriptional regulator YiaG
MSHSRTSTNRGRVTKRAENSASVTYMRVVEKVTSSGITQAELAKAVGTGPRSVQNWASGNNTPRGRSAEKLLDVHAIVDILSDSYTPEGIDIWFHSRNRNLDMRRPIDLLTEGDFDRVLDEAKWVAGGM